MNFGFIGAGNMGGALAVALSKKVSGENILLADKMTEKAKTLAKQIGATTSSNEEIALSAKYIFLAVKPQFMADMLAEIAPILKERTDEFILVSIAAGLSTEKIRDMAKGEYPVIRIMPNTPALLGEGMLLYTVTDGVSADDEKAFLEDNANAGKWDKIPENLIAANCRLRIEMQVKTCFLQHTLGGLEKPSFLLYTACERRKRYENTNHP